MSIEKVKYWLRWIMVFPGALIAGLLVTFPLHWLLYLKFNNGGTILGFIELPSGSDTFIEYNIYPLIIALTFVCVGYKIAPKYKIKTAIILFAVYFITWLIISIFSYYNDVGLFSWRTILALIGAILGLYIVNIIDKRKI